MVVLYFFCSPNCLRQWACERPALGRRWAALHITVVSLPVNELKRNNTKKNMKKVRHLHYDLLRTDEKKRTAKWLLSVVFLLLLFELFDDVAGAVSVVKRKEPFAVVG